MKKLLGILVLALVLSLACTAFAAGEISAVEGKLYNWGDRDFITKVGTHLLGDVVDWKAPTCTEYGWIEYDCTDAHAGIHTHIVRFFPFGHDWASLHDYDRADWGDVIVKPTCTEEGCAQDVCLVCGEHRDVFRAIDKINHEYDDKHYDVYKAPTCVATGLGQHTCIFCGAKKAGESTADMVVLPMIAHTFSDWDIKEESTCSKYGVAERGCLVCGMHQILDGTAAHDIIENGKHLRDVVAGVALKNPEWPVDPSNLVFDTEANYQAWKNAIKYEYEISENWLEDCYTRVLTFVCPYCGCKNPVHKSFTVTLEAPITISHVWNAKPELFFPAGLSLAPTCNDPGYYIYLCKYDGVGAERHGHALPVAGMSYKDLMAAVAKTNPITSVDGKVTKYDPQVKIEKIEPLGHEWSPWNVERVYVKDGKKYALDVRTCARCTANEEEIRELTDAEVKNGLVKDADGEWYYYENDELVAKTGIVKFEGGEFWVVNGKLASDATGLTICPDGVFYFLSQGQIQKVSQVVEYKGEWFKVIDGKLDETANGLYDYDGGKFVFAAGRLIKTVNGLWQNPKDGKWYFLANGQVQAKTGVASYNGEWFVIEDGILDADFNGPYEYDGETFNVVNGQLYPVAE